MNKMKSRPKSRQYGRIALTKKLGSFKKRQSQVDHEKLSELIKIGSVSNLNSSRPESVKPYRTFDGPLSPSLENPPVRNHSIERRIHDFDTVNKYRNISLRRRNPVIAVSCLSTTNQDKHYEFPVRLGRLIKGLACKSPTNYTNKL